MDQPEEAETARLVEAWEEAQAKRRAVVQRAVVEQALAVGKRRAVVVVR